MHTHKHNETIAACRTCLMCRHACTVGNVTQRDTNLPRGKALMLFAAQMELLDWDERALGAVVLCHLKRLREGPERLDVSLHAHVAQDKQSWTDRGFPERGIGRHEKGDADLGLDAVAK